MIISRYRYDARTYLYVRGHLKDEVSVWRMRAEQRGVSWKTMPFGVACVMNGVETLEEARAMAIFTWTLKGAGQ